ncbi:hypothetical protein ACFVS2_21175 [Brevibacillus sp. NPDC058079]|uniref:hypothetical protein n=1 Tax=Brevibacillus sp. NPDC058079 TaxID=3346330 RepID=UPI0036EB7CB1
MDIGRQEIRDFVIKTFNNPKVKAIRASHVAKHVGASPRDIQIELVVMHYDGLIGIQYELNCTRCFKTLDTKSNFTEFNSEYECICGEELEDIDPQQILMIFTNIDSLAR